MCEVCGPTIEHERTSAEQANLDELLGRIDENFARRGTSRDAILDPECYGTSWVKFSKKLRRFFFNIRVMVGISPI